MSENTQIQQTSIRHPQERDLAFVSSRLNKPSQSLEIPKGVLTIGELVGSWPGTETDEEIAEVLALLRG